MKNKLFAQFGLRYLATFVAALSCFLTAWSADQLNIDWTGKKVSILGDSYSTFAGTPGCEYPEYPSTQFNYGVTSADQLWWAQVIKAFGGELDTNCSCGRSFISNEGGNGVGGFLPRARQGLGNPDIIMIFGGLNDSWFNTPEVENNFESGINALFAYIKGTYKNATKYVIIPKAHVAEHYKQGCLAGYRSKLKASAKKYGMTPVDLDGAYGFGTSDMAGSQDFPHPNATGMKEIANRVIEVIRTPPKCEHPKCGFETTKEPTCTTAGERIWKCLDCGKNMYTNNIPAMQHAWSVWVTDPQDSSKDKHTCARCSTSESISKSAPHSTNLPANWGYSNRVSIAGINYCVLSFTNTSEAIKWTLPRSVSQIEFLTVGGGAGGGCADGSAFAAGGGGGGGAAFVGTFSGLTSGSVATIIVGTGGAGSTNSWKAGENGGDSTLGIDGEISCAMGGGGGGSIGAGPGSWGTGGGATARGGSDSANAGGKGLQGGRGGNSQPYNQAGYESYAIAAAGGGGAGGAGGNSEARKTGGTGGVGLACDITGETLYYGGGGGGGVGTESKSTDSLTRGVGGLGGGGTGGIGGMDSGYRQPDKGTPGTFFGGGGGGSLRRTNPTGNGYQGIVIVRYMDLSAPAGHTHYLSDFVTTVPATCSSEGVAVATCTNSGCTATPLKVTKMLAKLPHELGGVTVVTQPQVGQAGKMQQTCAVCGAVVSTTLPALTSLGDTDTEARTYTWLGESGSIWGLKENWKSNKSSSYGIPNSKDFATAVFPASLGSPLTVINPDYYQVKTLSVLAAAPVTLLGGSYSLSDSSFNFASGATLILDNSKIHTPRLTPRDAEDVTIIVRNGGYLDIEKGGLNYNSMSARMKVRVEGKNSEANLYSNAAMGPTVKGEGHIWEAVNGGKIYNNQGKSLFSDNEIFSQVLPTIRVADGGLFEVQYSDFLYGTRDDADTPTIIVEGKDSKFTAKQAMILGTNTVTSGGPTTLRFIPPAEGWSSSPMNASQKITIGSNTRIEVDASKVVMTSTSLDIPLLSSSNSSIEGDVLSLDKDLTPPTGATASLQVIDNRKIVLHLTTSSPTGKISIPVPTAVPNLVYTGSPIVGVSAGTGYTVSGGSATDVGSYTATCKISNTSSYEWSTGGSSDKTVSWSIAKAQNTWTTEPSYSNGRLTAAATKFGTPTATIQPTGGSAQAFTGTLPTTPGTYTLVYTAPAGTSNYSAPSLNTKSVTFEIKGSAPIEPPATEGIWSGKKVSILGDSISTYRGTPGSQNSEYAIDGINENNASKITLADGGQWWQQVLAATGATLERNVSCGGSAMSRSGIQQTFQSRASLGSKLGSPDIIFILGGANDDWVYDVGESEFTTGVTSLFNWLDSNYASAKKYVVLLGENVPNASAHANRLWGLRPMYRTVQKNLSNSHGYTVIDLNGVYPSKTEYGATDLWVHPNAAGLKVIADKVIASLGVSPAPSHTHSWSVWTTNGVSCTTAGTRTRTCSGCDKTETENIAALGHDWKVTSETATAINYECTRCHETRTETKGVEPTVADLPAEYQLLEYVQSTGSQYIDTGVAAKNGLTVKLNFKSEKASSSTDGILAAYSSGAEAYLPGVNQSGEMIVGLGSGTRATSRTLTTSSNEVEIAINSSGGFTLKVNGCEEGSQASCAAPTDCNLYLFARNTDNQAERFSKTTLYAAKFYEDGTKLIRYFVPVKNSDTHEVGLYDLKEGSFYSAQGGALTAGPEVNPEEPIEPPTPPEEPTGDLPTGYTPLTAVKTSGGCWFDTGIVGQPNLKVEANFVPSYYDKPYQFLLGSCDDAVYAYQRCDPLYFKYATVNLGAGHGYKQNPETTKLKNGSEFTVITTINASGEGGTVSVNGEAIESRLNKEETAGSTIEADGNGNTLYLATRNQGGSPSTDNTFEGEIRYVKIWTNGTVLARSYVPCRAKNGDVGFYDVAGGQGFQKSTGTAQFEPVGGSDPEEKPSVKPSEGASASTVTVQAASADAAKALVEIEPPTGVSIDRATYASYFKKSVSQKGENQFEVTVEIDLDKFAPSIEEAKTQVVAQIVDSSDDEIDIKVQPGFYYSLNEGSLLTNMQEGERKLATKASVSIPRTVKGGQSGFYQVLIHAEPNNK